MSTANLSLHLPDETELEAAAGIAADSTADTAEAIEASEAAAAVEEGDELDKLNEDFDEAEAEESRRFFEKLDNEPSGDADNTFADDPEATLLEEPADDAIDAQEAPESASEEVSDSASDSPSPTEAAGATSEPAAPESSPGPILAATPNRLTPHQPPKSAALVSFEHRRAEARDRYEGAMFEFRKLEAAAKAAKERWKDAEDQLYEILEQAGDFEGEEPAEQFDMHAERMNVPEGRGVIVGPAPETEPVRVVDVSAPPAADENSWRRVPTTELDLAGIKRFGAKRQEKLLDACPTIGELEDQRAKPGGLLSIEGIGREFADQIEDKLIAWLSKNRDRAVLAAASGAGAVEGEVDETAATPTEAVEEAAEESPVAELVLVNAPSQAAEEIAAQSEASDEAVPVDWHAEISARSQQIFFRTGDLSSVSPDDCLSQQLEDSRFWESGYEAYNAGHDLIDCGYIPGGERDDWLRGWMSAKLTNEEGWQGPGSE